MVLLVFTVTPLVYVRCLVLVCTTLLKVVLVPHCEHSCEYCCQTSPSGLYGGQEHP